MSVDLLNKQTCNVILDHESILNAYKNGEVAITRGDVVFSPAILNWSPEQLAQLHGSVEVSTHAKFNGTNQFVFDRVSIKDFVPKLLNARGTENEIEGHLRSSYYAAVNTRRILKQDLVGGLIGSEHEHQFGFLWLGFSQGGLHCDHFNNILVQVHGRKRLTVFPPNVSDQISPAHFVPLPNTYDIFCPENIERNEWLKHLPHYVIDMNPGDAVVIPSTAYHSASALSVDSVSVNSFFTPRDGKYLNKWVRKINKVPWPVTNAFIGLSRWTFSTFGFPIVKFGHYEVM